MARRHLALVIALCAIPLLAPTTASASHGFDKDCPDFASQSDAQAHYDGHGYSPSNDPERLDADNDGVACNANPCPCARPGQPAPPPDPTPTPSPSPEPEPAPQPERRVSVTFLTTARIASVVDGDTVKIRYRSGRTRTTRLLGLDTPETRKPGTPVECGGPQATAYMRKLALNGRHGRVVRVLVDESQDRTDRFGRDLRVVEIAGKDVAERMVRAGHGIHYIFDDNPVLRADRYQAAQDAAQTAGRGIWARCGGEVHKSRAR